MQLSCCPRQERGFQKTFSLSNSLPRSSQIFPATHPEIKEVLVHGDGEVRGHHERVVAARGEKIDSVDGDGGVVHGLREGQVGHGGAPWVVLVERHLVPGQGGILSENMITK